MSRRRTGLALVILAWLLAPASLQAGEVEIVAAEAYPLGDGEWRFNVTLRHDDTGWDHYADKWEVLAPDGRVLGVRVLHHPHVEEQPFTRSLGGVKVPQGVTEVTVRAHDSVHGYAQNGLIVDLSR